MSTFRRSRRFRFLDSLRSLEMTVEGTALNDNKKVRSVTELFYCLFTELSSECLVLGICVCALDAEVELDLWFCT